MGGPPFNNLFHIYYYTVHPLSQIITDTIYYTVSGFDILSTLWASARI